MVQNSTPISKTPQLNIIPKFSLHIIYHSAPHMHMHNRHDISLQPYHKTIIRTSNSRYPFRIKLFSFVIGLFRSDAACSSNHYPIPYLILTPTIIIRRRTNLHTSKNNPVRFYTNILSLHSCQELTARNHSNRNFQTSSDLTDSEAHYYPFF